LDAALQRVVDRSEKLSTMSTHELAQLHALLKAAFASAETTMQEQLQAALGVSKSELRRIYEAGEAMNEAVASGNTAVVAQSERDLRALYKQVDQAKGDADRAHQELEDSMHSTQSAWEHDYADAAQHLAELDRARQGNGAQLDDDVRQLEASQDGMTKRMDGALDALEGATTDSADHAANVLEQEGEKAEQTTKLEDTKEAKRTKKGQREVLEDKIDNLHKTCDFLMAEYAKLKAERTKEEEGLKASKEVLAGVKLGKSFLQHE
jgi:chromosome segregation ATPase